MTSLDIVAVATVALFVKMFVVASLQGVYRLRHGRFTRPEDAAHWGNGEVADEEHGAAARAQRTLRNDLENIPIFLFLLWAYASVEAWPAGAAWYAGAFVLSRVVHTAAYLRPIQPLRNRAYLVGSMVCLALSGHLVYAIFF